MERRRRLFPETASLRLGALKRGQLRAVRLRLMAISGSEKLPTEWYLDVKACCDEPGRVYYLDVKVDFGPRPPASARLTLLKSRYEADPPVKLVENGVCVEKGLPLEIRPETDKVVFWVATEGAKHIPQKLAAEIRVRPGEPPSDPPTSELDTMRLPSIKVVIAERLAEALAASAHEPFVVFRAILAAPSPMDAVRDVSRLIDARADIALVEAAVRVLEAAEQSGKAGPPINFADLCFNDPAGAAIAIFHTQTPSYLVNQAFVIALENHLVTPPTAAAASPWRELAKAAAVVLVRSDGALLEEDLELYRLGDPFRARILRMTIEWAERRREPLEPPPAPPLAEALTRVADPQPGVSLRAVREVLLAYGFIGVSAQLD